MRKEAAVVIIQKKWQGSQAWKAYHQLQFSALIIQTGLRGMSTRKEFRLRRETSAATVIQAQWRCHRGYLFYRKQQKASIVIQCRWRGRTARRELKKLKMAARETGALQEAKEKLEKQVEELTRQLKMERHLRIELNEEKSLEIQILHDCLQVMQIQVDEKNSLLTNEQEAGRRGIEEDPPVIEKMLTIVQDTDKIDTLTAEVENMKVLLQLETQRGDILERKYTEAQEVSGRRCREVEQTNGNHLVIGEIDALTAEVENLKVLLQLETQRACMLERRYAEAQEGSDRRCQDVEKIEGNFPVIEETSRVVQDSEKIDILIAEVENLKVLLQLETRRADMLERKYAEAQEVSERRCREMERTNGNHLVIEEILTVESDTEKIDTLTAEVENLKALLQLETQRADMLERRYAKAQEGSARRCQEPNVVQDTEKIDSLTAEVENLKVLLQLETQRTDTVERKYADAQEVIEQLSWKLEQTEGSSPVMEETSIVAPDTEKNEVLAAEMENLKILLHLETQRADTLERKYAAVEEVSEQKCQEVKHTGGNCPVIEETPTVVQDTEKINTLIAEVENLKILLHIETQRANLLERKFVEAQEVNEERCQQLEQTEGNVKQLQESLNRVYGRDSWVS